MSDPRYSRGRFVGFSPLEKRQQRTQQILASPLMHGWQPVNLLNDGRRVWQLEGYPQVTMHRVSQADKDRLGLVNEEWLVYIDDRPYAGYSGDLVTITADVLAVVMEREVAA